MNRPREIESGSLEGAKTRLLGNIVMSPSPQGENILLMTGFLEKGRPLLEVALKKYIKKQAQRHFILHYIVKVSHRKRIPIIAAATEVTSELYSTIAALESQDQNKKKSCFITWRFLIDEAVEILLKYGYDDHEPIQSSAKRAPIVPWGIRYINGRGKKYDGAIVAVAVDRMKGPDSTREFLSHYISFIAELKNLSIEDAIATAIHHLQETLEKIPDSGLRKRKADIWQTAFDYYDTPLEHVRSIIRVIREQTAEAIRV